MNIKNIYLTLLLSGFTLNAMALSPEAESGKSMMDICNICHADNLFPPKAPPFYVVKQRYQSTTKDKADFVESMTTFMATPSKESALLPMAVDHLGPHPKLGFPDQDMQKIAAFIFENSFAPPCAHWQAGMKMAEKSNDMAHHAIDKQQFEQHCSTN